MTPQDRLNVLGHSDERTFGVCQHCGSAGDVGSRCVHGGGVIYTRQAIKYVRADALRGAVARVAELEAHVADLQAEKRAYRAAGDELAAELDRLTRGQ
jgi:hypothetical protein